MYIFKARFDHFDYLDTICAHRKLNIYAIQFCSVYLHFFFFILEPIHKRTIYTNHLNAAGQRFALVETMFEYEIVLISTISEAVICDIVYVMQAVVNRAAAYIQ